MATLSTEPVAGTERSNAPAPTPYLATPFALAAVVIGAALAWWAAPHVANRLQQWLPAAATVRSRGTPFPSLRLALPFAIRATAVIVVVAALVARIATVVPDRLRWPKWASWTGLAAVVVVGAAVYGHYGYPHNAFLTDARFHWVDIYFDRANNWWYTLVKLPHRLFYNEPYVLQALNGALNAALMYAIGRTIFRRGPLPIVMAVAYLGSSLMLLFADTAEDVQLNIAALLVAYLCYLRRATPWTGVALFVVMLGRPQLLYVWAAVVVAEFLVGDVARAAPGWKARLRALVHERFVVVNLAVASALFVCWDLFLVVRGQNWLFRNGHVIDQILVDIEPSRTDGFKIFAFSGAYVLHSLWVFPTFMLVACVVALMRLRELPPVARRALVFGMLIVFGGIVVSEAEPLFYYNIRYLSYLFPALLVAAFTVLALPVRGRPWIGRPAAAALLCLGVFALRWQFVDQHRTLVANPVSRTFAHRGQIKSFVGRAPAATTSSKIGVRNYLSYILRRPYDDIPVIRSDDSRFRGYVFTISPTERVRDGVVVLRDGPLEIYRVEGRTP